MRNEFYELVGLLNSSVVLDINIVNAINKLEQKIIEVEKRIECVIRANKDNDELVYKLAKSFQDEGKLEEIIGYADFETMQRSVYDIEIALNLEDEECIENNWYGLFGEPKRELPIEEPKVLIPKGSILVWDYSRKYYSAKGGAKAKVSEDYKEDDDYIKVEWLDERANNQENGGYERDMFKEEFELPKEEVAPTYQCRNKDTFDKVKEVIQILKTLDNGDCVDGETMQYILEQVGMEVQMLNQLNKIFDIWEKIELANK